MSFWSRLRYYLIGISMGLVLSFMLFKNRGCGWLPGNRVLDTISAKPVFTSDSVHCLLQCNAISDADVFNLFYSGDVNFSESKVDEAIKQYVLSGKKEADGSMFKINFSLYDDHSEITEVINSSSCNCKTDSLGKLHQVFMPDVLVRKLFQESSFATTSSSEAQLQALKMHPDSAKQLLFIGDINRTLSTPYSQPHPFYVVEGSGYVFEVELVEKSTRLLSVKAQQ